VVIAGLLYGVSEALITALFGSAYTQMAMFTAVILALALAPQGLFSSAPIKKV
jgi:branched-chain amino acid transport system permease protein